MEFLCTLLWENLKQIKKPKNSGYVNKYKKNLRHCSVCSRDVKRVYDMEQLDQARRHDSFSNLWCLNSRSPDARINGFPLLYYFISLFLFIFLFVFVFIYFFSFPTGWAVASLLKFMTKWCTAPNMYRGGRHKFMDIGVKLIQINMTCMIFHRHTHYQPHSHPHSHKRNFDVTYKMGHTRALSRGKKNKKQNNRSRSSVLFQARKNAERKQNQRSWLQSWWLC